MIQRSSLTLRLSALFALLMSTLLILGSVCLFRALEQHFAELDFEELDGKITLVSHMLDRAPPGASWHELSRRIEEALIGHEGLTFTIADASGRTLFRYAPQALLRTLRHGEPQASSYATHEDHRGPAFRQRERQIVTRGVPARLYRLRATLDSSHHDRFVEALRRSMLGFVGVMVILSGGIGWVAARVGLKPLRDLAKVAASINADKLHERLPIEDVPRELQGPVTTFNAMLERLQHSFERLSAFSSDIAHELRTPINNLMMQTQVSLSRERPIEHYQEILYSNLDEFQRLARMINDMLFLAKSDHGLLALKPERLALQDELAQLLEFFEPLASETGITLSLKGQGTFEGDRLMLRRAFNNLLSNAIKYAYPQTTIEIEIEIEHRSSALAVAIRNVGRVIPEEHRARIFDRFYRADAARQHDTEGVGLGLAITKSIVEAHGGAMLVQSDPQKTIFTVLFPQNGVGLYARS